MNKKLNLKELVKNFDGEDTTERIRELKHSKQIRASITKMIELKKKYSRLNNKNLRKIVEKQCSFLYHNYTNIFNKIYKDVIDLKLFNKFLVILEGIENGKYDQHEASAKVGQILKEIYIDSAIRESKRIDKKNSNKKKPVMKKGKKISWNEFKILNEDKKSSAE